MGSISPFYKIGTASVGAGSTAVTGVGTNWKLADGFGFQPGDQFRAAGLSVSIASVNSATSITLASGWPGAARSNAEYEILRLPDTNRFLEAQSRFLVDLAANLSAFGELTLGANKGIHATGAGALATHDLSAFARTLLDDADAATARATLQAGGLAAANTWTADQRINARLGINANPVYWLDFLAPSGTQSIARLGQAGISNGLQISTDGASLSYNFTMTGPNTEVTFSSLATTAVAGNAVLDAASRNKLLRSTSSLVYKKDVENIESWRADDLVRLARPVWYRSKAAADRPDWGWYGLIAEEVAAIDPRLVHWAYQADQYEDVEVPETVEDTVEEEGDNGEIVTRTVQRTVMRTERQLKPGAELRPDGVQYDRIPVMLLDVVRRQAETIATQQQEISALQMAVASIATRQAALEGE